MSREDFLHSIKSGEQFGSEEMSDIARGSRDTLVWPLLAVPRGILILLPKFLVFLTDDQQSATRRIVSFSFRNVAARVAPFYNKIETLARTLGFNSFDRVRALDNPRSFFITRSDIAEVRSFWRATHGGIVHVRTHSAHSYYIYQDMHSTSTWHYLVHGGWRWHKRLAKRIKDTQHPG